MNYELRTAPAVQLFNESIGGLRLTKSRSLILASLFVAALFTLLSVPVQGLPESSVQDPLAEYT